MLRLLDHSLLGIGRVLTLLWHNLVFDRLYVMEKRAKYVEEVPP